jgi:hypothetical protein
MAKGKETGAFSHKITSTTLLPGPAGSMLSQVNVDGTASGYGTILGTATFVGGKSGTFTGAFSAFLGNGDQMSGTGNGAYESVGVHRWLTQLVVHVSDGTLVYSEGHIDLASRSWVGKNYEWN